MSFQSDVAPANRYSDSFTLRRPPLMQNPEQSQTKSVLAYTDKSLADGHGFVRITFPGGEVIEELCTVQLRSGLNDQSSENVDPHDITFLYENGGCKDFSAVMKKALGIIAGPKQSLVKWSTKKI